MLSVLVLLGVSLGLILVLGHGEPALDTIHDEYSEFIALSFHY